MSVLHTSICSYHACIPGGQQSIGTVHSLPLNDIILLALLLISSYQLVIAYDVVYCTFHLTASFQRLLSV